MKTIFNKTKLTMRKSLSSGGLRAVLMVLLIVLGVGNAWGSDSYYTGFKATGGATGNGYVYASTSGTATPAYDTEVVGQEKSSDTGSSSGSNTYYAWAKAVRGSEFKSWSISGSSNGVTPTSSTDQQVTVIVTSNKKNGTNTGTATASWDSYTKVNVTYNKSDDGEYTVAYSYNSYNSTDKTITAGDAEGLGCTINSDNGSKTIGSYYNDVITLTSTKGDFQGWYSDAGFNTLLSTANPYTYVAPQSGTGSVYAKYPHVDKYYGRLTASIAEVPYSMPAGGMIFISKEEAAAPVYSENAQTVENVGMGTTSLTYYLKAQPTDKRYVFRGWYSNAQCTGTPLSTNKEYTYTFTASSKTEASPTTGNIYAAFDFNLYYMQVEVKPGTASQGLGMVLVSDTKLTSPAYTEFSSESSQFAYAYRLAPTTDVYVYAKPKYGYKLSGWYTDAACTQAVTVASDGKYTATGTNLSTDPMNPTIIPIYAKFVEDATTVNITYNKPDQTKGEYTASVLDIVEVDDEYVWTFTEVFTSVGKTANTVQAQHKTDVLKLEAVCKAGYGVTSWTIAGSAKTTPSHLYEISATAAATYGVTFGDAKPFLVCSSTSATTGTAYATLREALDNLGSNKKIVVVQNAYVPAGNYTIPSGVTLLVPYSADYKVSGQSVQRTTTNANTNYMTLTIGSGANITVASNAAIEVGATQYCGSTNSATANGKPATFGKIIMDKESSVSLQNGGKLYCWGYIVGTGTISAQNGSTVYECFQMTDYGGGNKTSSILNNSQKVFPITQYFIQNIEAPITFAYGSKDLVSSAVNVSIFGIQEANNVEWLTTSSSNNGLFRLASGATVLRKYDGAADRQVYIVNGNTSIDNITISLSVSLVSANYRLPITNNMTIHVESGTTTIKPRIDLAPDAEIYIGKEAKVIVESELIVEDVASWGNASGAAPIRPHNYVPGRTYTNTTTSGRTADKLKDAKLCIEGELQVSTSTGLYTCGDGANICSTTEHPGKIILKAAAPSNLTFYHETSTSTSASWVSVTAKPANLRNGDGSFVGTAGAAKNDQFIYSKNLGIWMKNPKTVTWNANGGTTEATTMAYSEGAFIGELPAAYRDGYTLAGWFTTADGGTQISQTTKVTNNITYYAHWTPKQYDITYMDQGKAAFSSTHIDSPNAHPTKHTYGTATTLNGANNKTGYDFGGWHTISNCKAESRVTTLAANGYTKDITLYAKWTPQEYTITYKDKGDAAFSGTSWSSTQPTKHTYGTATTLVNPSKANYTFGGWYTTSACTGSEVTSLGATDYTENITLYAKWNEATHTVTVAAGANGSVSPTSVSGVGVATASDYITATPNTGYSFSGWTLPESGVTAASGYTTSSNPIQINATADGKTITANFAVVNYNVTYTAPSNGSYTIKVADAAAVSASTTAQYNQTVVLSATPEEGYKFDHWTVTKANSSTVTVTDNQFTMPAEAVTVSVTFLQDNFDVTFDVQGHGVAPAAQSIAANGKVTEPAAPSAENYQFDGWYKEPACTNAWDFASDVVTADMILYAKWTLTPYDITLHTNEGTINSGNVTSYTYGVGATLPNDVTRIGYDFDGWFSNSECTGDAVTTISATTIGDKEFWAKWTPIQYTITWLNYNGSDLKDQSIESFNYFGEHPAYSTVNYGIPTRAESNGRTYEWDGWTTEVNGSGTFYPNDGLPEVQGNVTYYAHFRITAIEVETRDNIEIDENSDVEVTVVHVNGTLTVEDGATLTTNDLILEATPTTSGEIIGREAQQAIAANGTATFKFSQPGGFTSRTWYSVAVPWQVDVPHNADYTLPCDIYAKKGEGAFARLNLGSTIDIIYYDGIERAANGHSDACWKYVEDDGFEEVMMPGKAYMFKLLNNADTLCFVRKSNTPLRTRTTEVVLHNSGSTRNENWNGIANPATYHAYLDARDDEEDNIIGYIYDGDKKQYKQVDMDKTKLVVGQAVYIQAPKAQSIVANPTVYANPSQANLAPRRVAANDLIARYDVYLGTEEETAIDRVVVRVDEDKEDEYVIAKDLVKFEISPKVAQMWVNCYDERLAMNTLAPVNDQAIYPLGISVPQAGEYHLYVANELAEDDNLYLTYDGRVIWNIGYAPYVLSLEKGVNEHYGLRLIHNAPGMEMDVDQVEATRAAQKMLIDQKVYILRGEQLYSITGQKAE